MRDDGRISPTDTRAAPASETAPTKNTVALGRRNATVTISAIVAHDAKVAIAGVEIGPVTGWGACFMEQDSLQVPATEPNLSSHAALVERTVPRLASPGDYRV